MPNVFNSSSNVFCICINSGHIKQMLFDFIIIINCIVIMCLNLFIKFRRLYYAIILLADRGIFKLVIMFKKSTSEFLIVIFSCKISLYFKSWTFYNSVFYTCYTFYEIKMLTLPFATRGFASYLKRYLLYYI